MRAAQAAAVPVPLEGDQTVGAADGLRAAGARRAEERAAAVDAEFMLVVLGVGILQRHGGGERARRLEVLVAAAALDGRLRTASVDGYAAFAVSRGLDEGLAGVGEVGG